MYFICIYMLYNDVLSIFSFLSRGVFENFTQKRGSSKIFEDPSPTKVFCTIVLYKLNDVGKNHT